MKGAQTLFDAFRASGVRADETDMRKIASPLQYQCDVASDMVHDRAHSLGMSDEQVEQAIKRGKAFVYAAYDHCESPIEKRLLPWLVFADYSADLLTIPADVHLPKIDPTMPRGDVVIVPQFAFAKYRMDFAIVTRLNGVMRVTCVECDGREYHSQIADKDADAERDGYLSSWGMPTVRLAGKEIFASPLGCITRIATVVQEQLGRA